MEEVKNTVPYIVYEGEQARNERHIKRLIIALVTAILVILISNALWLYAWTQYDYSGEETVTVDGTSGIANYIGESGIISNGKDCYSAAQDAPEEGW